MVNSKVSKGGGIKHVIAGQCTAIDNAGKHNPGFYDQQEHLPLRIGNDWGVHAASLLKSAKDRHFTSCPATPFALAASTKITFVDFNGTCKEGAIFQLLRNDFPQTVAKETSRVLMNANFFGGHASCYHGFTMSEQSIDLKRPGFPIL